MKIIDCRGRLPTENKNGRGRLDSQLTQLKIGYNSAAREYFFDFFLTITVSWPNLADLNLNIQPFEKSGKFI